MEEKLKRYIIESFRDKYHRSKKKVKGQVLEEVCKLLNCHRKHAIRVMKGKKACLKKPEKRGRKSKYNNPEFLSALHKVRRVMEFRNAEVIKENMSEWLPYIEKHRGVFSKEVRNNLLTISASTMKRFFKRAREQAGTGLSTTRPGSILRTEIPIRTESFWDEEVPGKMAADTVAHCGNTTKGEYANSLDVVCPVTHWTIQQAVWGKGHTGVLEASKTIEEKLPFPLLGWHVDNGGEFINHAFISHYTNEPHRANFSFTRSRANQKNDNCHIEQKNWSVVRRYFGYDRLDCMEIVPMMNDLYSNELYLYLNHFCRTFKLEKKIAIKSRYRRVYGAPLTPYHRVLASPHVSNESKLKLKIQHDSLDPVFLKMEIERKLRIIYARYKKITKSRSVTSAA